MNVITKRNEICEPSGKKLTEKFDKNIFQSEDRITKLMKETINVKKKLTEEMQQK